MDQRQRRIARARLLRREGKTYDEIRDALGLMVSDDTIAVWLKGISRPRETLRGRAKDELRRECRRLRAQGLTYSEIAARTGASKGSVSPWVRDIKMAEPSKRRHEHRSASARQRAGDTHSRRAAMRREQIRQSAASRFGDVTERDLFVAGLALYWAEGGKDKPWRRSGRAVLINSDPTLLELFLAWLDLLEVPEDDRCYRLNIHETADVAVSEKWWAERLHIPLASFARATIKIHKPTTVRHNRGTGYHGCLIVSVRRSGGLYYAIEGWWSALTQGAGRRPMVHTEGANWSPVG